MGGALAWIGGVLAVVLLVVAGLFAGLTGTLAMDAAETASTIPPEVEAAYRQVALRTGVHWAALAAWDGAVNGYRLPLPTLESILGELVRDLLDSRQAAAEEWCRQHPDNKDRCPPDPPELTPQDERLLWQRAYGIWRWQLIRYVEAHAAALSVPEFEENPEVVYARLLGSARAAKAAELLEGLVVLEGLQADADEILVDVSEPPPDWGPVDGFAWPVLAPITSRYGMRISPIDGVRRLHAGIDLGVVTGTPIRASKAGTVVAAQWDTVYGQMVRVDHGDGYSTLYAHASRLAVHPGQTVEQGQVVAYAGDTGWSRGAHLHFEVHFRGSPVDPLLVLTERSGRE